MIHSFDTKIGYFSKRHIAVTVMQTDCLLTDWNLVVCSLFSEC